MNHTSLLVERVVLVKPMVTLPCKKIVQIKNKISSAKNNTQDFLYNSLRFNLNS